MRVLELVVIAALGVTLTRRIRRLEERIAELEQVVDVLDARLDG